MKSINALSFAVAVLLTPAANCQQQTTAFDFRAVVQPGMTIGGYALDKTVTINSAALNDAGRIVFSAYCPGIGTMIFADDRIIAKAGDAIDGKVIVLIDSGMGVAINKANQIAFEAWYADTKEIADGGEASAVGIFVEKHLALIKPSAAINDPFSLTDDGHVLLSPEARSAPKAVGQEPAVQKKPGLLDRIRVSPLKLPVGPSITLGPEARPQQPGRSPRDSGRLSATPIPLLRTNRLGQSVIPVNLPREGFLILLATPVAH